MNHMQRFRSALARWELRHQRSLLVVRDIYPLPLFTLMALVTWAFYHQFSTRVTPAVDYGLLLFIAIVSTECVVIMLVFTRRYRVLSLGLMSFFLATGILYYSVSSAGLMGSPLLPPPPAPTYGIFQGRIYIELIRALYLDAAILVAIGLNRWAWRHRHEAFPWHRNLDANPSIFFEPEREDLP